MDKDLPPRLRDHILPFDWDVRRVWELSAPCTQRALADFEYLLDLPLWSSKPGCGMLFDISPRQVLESPERSPHQTQRIHEACTEYPIDLLHYQGREWILDGVHRIAKLIALAEQSIQLRIHDESVIPHITTLGN